MQSFTLGGEVFKYSVQKGKVTNFDAHSEMRVSSSSTGDGYVKSVGSSTYNHQNFYLEDKEGKPFVVNLTDWNISAIQGHELLFIRVENRNKNNYGLIYNKTLDIVYHNGFFQEYFKVTDDGIGCFKLVLGAIGLVAVPTIAYGVTLSEAVAFTLFMVMLAIIILIFVTHGRQKDRGDKKAQALKEKVDQILNDHKK
jgi:hypothetical protein